MKKSLLIFLFVAFAVGIKAQSLTLIYEGEALNHGDTVVAYGELPENEPHYMIVNEVQVKNNTDRSVHVMVERITHSTVEGSVNNFCWGYCFGPDTSVSPESIEIEPNEMTAPGVFSADYMPMGNPGVSILEYKFYNESDPDDFVTYVVKFHASPVSIDEFADPILFGNAYPNPATNMVSFDYNLVSPSNSGILKIFNLLGQPVMEQHINATSGKLELSVAELKEGVYLYSVQVNNQTIITRKLVVRR